MISNNSKQTKYKKIKKGKLKNFEFKTNKLTFGQIGLKTLESGIISAKQIEAARQATKKIKKTGKIWVKIFPNLPITSKSIGVRMGKGKGQISHWGARVLAGTVLFEYCGVCLKSAIKALQSASSKLPVKTKIFK